MKKTLMWAALLTVMGLSLIRICSIGIYSKVPNGTISISSLKITLPEGLRINVYEQDCYYFEDFQGSAIGWICIEKYIYNAFSEWMPNHSRIGKVETIDTAIGKGRVFTLEVDNGTAASGISGTHHVYYAIIPLSDDKRCILEFSRNDRSVTTKEEVLYILENMKMKGKDGYGNFDSRRNLALRVS